MGRSSKIECMFCDKKFLAGASLCEHCGRPTQWASHDERVEWEVSQWRQTRAEAPVPAMAAVAAQSARPNGASADAPHRPTPPSRRPRKRAPEPVVEAEAPHEEIYVAQPSRPPSYAARRSSRVAPEPGAPKPIRAPEPVAEPAPAARAEVKSAPEVRSNGHAPAAQTNGAIVAAKKGASLFSRLKQAAAPASTPEEPGRVVRLEDVEKKKAPARPKPSTPTDAIEVSDQPAAAGEEKKPLKAASKKPATQKAMLEQALDMLGTLEGRMAAVESHLLAMAEDRPAPRRFFRRRAQ